MGRESPGKLTAKQEKFVNAWVETGNKSEAYRRAYATKNMNDNTIKVKASILSRKDNVRITYEKIINEAKEQAKEKYLWPRERAYKELLELLADSKRAEQFPTRINAIKELNSLSDLYPKDDKKENEATEIVFNISPVEVNKNAKEN